MGEGADGHQLLVSTQEASGMVAPQMVSRGGHWCFIYDTYCPRTLICRYLGSENSPLRADLLTEAVI
jgi:hypothetical protein